MAYQKSASQVALSYFKSLDCVCVGGVTPIYILYSLVGGVTPIFYLHNIVGSKSASLLKSLTGWGDVPTYNFVTHNLRLSWAVTIIFHLIDIYVRKRGPVCITHPVDFYYFLYQGCTGSSIF